ncbi:TP901 family phage tail tape measure protein [Ruminiclostridium sufflavum DSM 19573]|uniref:TP901 family phage tail tape measure protein n=1 Tax=Ruminiclostridium sufflavum DSM 19573 TaxID=1121337 RepID=A0A318XHQ7_9FIRM|nr:phage tail tape measure protein [Ruminiclostridium sufflavum]PYG86740.1 TP901 family phage tail tape measure protein [Ruminiclostridium sufflavum DSM 19573]
MSLESVFKLSLIMNMIDNLTSPMARVQASVGGSVSKLQGMQQTFGDVTKAGTAMAGIGAQITDAALSPVQATFATKKALGELSSVGVKDLKALEKASENFSNTWAGTSKAEFIGAAYDIKSGIASLNDEAVAKYTEIAGITAKGTKATIGEMTSLFATGYGIYKDFYKDMSDIDFGEMFAAGIGHAANIFKTDGPQMAQAISRLGAAATSAKVPMEEQFSILGMLQATMSGSEAGTKYRAFLQSAARAGQELGLKFTDANNQLLSMPEILSLLKGKFGETMDAAEKMQLQKAFGTDEAVAMVDLMYSKMGELQEGILSVYDSMGQGINEVTEMANAINSTEPDQYQILQQRLHSVAEEIGNSLLPTFNQMLSKGTEILTRFSEWVKNNQELVKVITLIVLAIGSFLTAAGTIIAVVGGVGLVFTKTAGFINNTRKVLGTLPGLFETIHIKALYAGDGLKKGFSTIKTFASSAVTGIKNVAVNIGTMAKTAAINGATALKNMAAGLVGMARQAITTAVTAMPGLIASVWSFTAALLANPITWIVVGIVALIAAIILLWQNWDSVVSWIQGVWNGFVNGIKAGFEWITNLFSGMPIWLQIAIAAFMPFIGIPLLIITHWDSIVAFFTDMWTRIKEGFVNGINAIKNFFLGVPEWFKESGGKIIDTLVEGIKGAAMKPVQAVKNIFAKVRELLPFSDAHEGPLSQLTLSGHRTMSTIAEGIEKGSDLPYQAVEKGFSKIDTTGERKPVKKVNFKEVSRESESSEKTTEKENGVTIDKLILSVDFSKIKELPLLLKLLKEIEDFTNSNGLITQGEG